MITLVTRSYDKDFEWLSYSILSMRKNLYDISHKLLIVPENTIIPNNISEFYNDIVFTVETKEGYVAQQIDKVGAYRYTDNAYLLYTDSDCIYYEPFYAMSMLDNSKIILPRTPYRELSGNVLNWQSIVKKMTGIDTEYEYMRAFPMMFHRDTCTLLDNNAIYNNYKHNVVQREFTEFNALGAIAETNHPELYKFTSKTPVIRATQYWSWGGITDEIRQQLETINNVSME